MTDLASRQLDGLIVAGAGGPPVDHPASHERAPRRRPTVIIDSAMPVAGTKTVGADKHDGAVQAVRHLLDEHGHDSVALLMGRGARQATDERENGWRDALRDGRPTRGRRSSTRRSRDMAAISPVDGSSPALTTPGIFAGSDLLAVGLLRAAHEAGLRCPRTSPSFSFDGTQQSEYCWPPLTTRPAADPRWPRRGGRRRGTGRPAPRTSCSRSTSWCADPAAAPPARRRSDQSPSTAVAHRAGSHLRSERAGRDRDRLSTTVCCPARRGSRAGPRHDRRPLAVDRPLGGRSRRVDRCRRPRPLRGRRQPGRGQRRRPTGPLGRAARALDGLGRATGTPRLAPRRGLVAQVHRDRSPARRHSRSRPPRRACRRPRPTARRCVEVDAVDAVARLGADPDAWSSPPADWSACGRR